MNTRIKEARKAHNLSQEAFGRKIGISGASVSKIESGENNPSEQTVKLICREFNVSYSWLVDGFGEMKQPPQDEARGKLESIMRGDNEFVKFVFRQLADMPIEFWREMESMVDKYIEEKKSR